MSNVDDWSRLKKRVALLAGIVPPNDDSYTGWTDAVRGLPAHIELRRPEVSCLCGLTTEAALRYRERIFRRLPWQERAEENAHVIALKKKASLRLRARWEDEQRANGTHSTPRKKMVKTKRVVEFVQKGAADKWRADFNEFAKDNQLDAGAIRGEKKKKGEGKLTREEWIALELKKLAKRWADGDLKLVRDVVIALVNRDGAILAFTPAQPMDENQVAETLLAGGRMEMMSLHEALTERTWVDLDVRAPWAELYAVILANASGRVARHTAE